MYQIDEKGLESATECWWAMHSSKLGQTNCNHNMLVRHPWPSNRSTDHLEQALSNLVEFLLLTNFGIPCMLPEVGVVVKGIQITLKSPMRCNEVAKGRTLSSERWQGRL